ncbi:uncharacterized protein DUF4386 [Christiangramia gaetbulicola]|uniref:Uncharacterized protein DUF4386 n=1 Tax=Christiangramia gaetbulicola TaxID=703340 RepID=A0A2T6AI71_9FLAO|nr:DUF4386 domain-containing protein [Christiangramia gaetbulicola]PTX43487.1 uncharacterized protein DUF4386 [Christiangramia gaetbulicola]
MAHNIKQNQLVKTARIAGIWYLLLAISGVLGFLVYHPQIFVSGDSEKTLTNLINLESIARLRLLLEFAIVVSQALTAVWFYKLFKNSNEWAAWTLGIWGMVNSVVIMLSAIFMASAISMANSANQIFEEKVLLIQISQEVIANAWGVGGLFFGLWLLPMGYLVIKSRMMPVWLGRVILIGGVGYLISTIINYLGIDLPYNRILILPATIGEFWMIGYLLIYGVRTVKE